MVYKIVSASLSVLLMLGATGCGAYRRKPIVDRQVLRDLQAIRLEGLGEVEGKPDQKAPKISSSEGLSADEAVVVALYLNPDLRAFRKEKGVAEGELLTARQFPNPEIQASVLANLPGSGVGIGANTLAAILSPLRPGERGARVALAQARIEEIKSQVSAEEWRFTAEVKKGYLTLWASEEQLKIQDTSVRLQERIMKFFRDKRDLGDASRLDLNLVNLEYTQALLQREAATNERDRARQALLAVLGLPPLYNLKLKAATDPIAYKPFQVEPATLETFMIERRPQLAAAKQEYEQAEQTLRLAYIQRIPWFRLGPSYERESGGGEGTTNRLGLGVGIDLPLFNRNQGAIVSLEAARDKLREGFTAKVHTARVKMNEAYRSLRAQERLIRLYQDSIKPTLEENAELTESGFQLGEFNLIQLITTQDKVLASRREFVASELEYWKAAIDLEAAIGAPLSEAEANKKQP